MKKLLLSLGIAVTFGVGTITAQMKVIAGGASHSILLCGDSTALSFGANWDGQLGDGTTINSTTPVQVSVLSSITEIVATKDTASSSMALRNDSTVWTWGNNFFGQLGDGTNINSSTPVQVLVVSNIVAIAGGGVHLMALRNDSTVWTWGGNWFGQLGDSTTTNSTIPVQVLGLSNIVAIAGGGLHSMALRNDSTVWTWGVNWNGELGDSTTTNSTTPVQVLGLSDIVAIAAGGGLSGGHSMALRNNSTVWTWGDNWSGQLGDSTTTDRTIPVQVLGLSNIVAIAGGGQHSMALRNDSTVWTWGNNWSGQLGDSTTTDRTTPVQVFGLNNIVAIAAAGGLFGDGHSMALSNDSIVSTWGANWFGQLGDGTTTERTTPVQIMQLNSCTIICNVTASFTSSITNICAGEFINFTNTSQQATTYQWQEDGITFSTSTNTTRTFSTPGSFIISLIAISGCSDTANVIVTVDSLPTVTFAALLDVCNNAVAFALSGGSPAGGTYLGTGVNGGNFNPSTVTAGTYTITYTYTDSVTSCINSTTQTITVIPLPIVTLAAFSNICIDTAAFVLTGGSPAGGAYSGTGVSGVNFDPAIATSGTHTITYTYTDSVTGCTNSAIQVITVNPLPLTPTITQNGADLISSSATGNQWYLDSVFLIIGENLPTYTPTQNGTYTVIVTDMNGCSSISAPFNFTSIGMKKSVSTNTLKIYPNPNTGGFIIEIINIQGFQNLVGLSMKIKLLNITGQVIYEENIAKFTGSYHKEIDLQNYPKGLYYLQIISNNAVINKIVILE